MPFWDFGKKNAQTIKFNKDIKKDSLMAKYQNELKQTMNAGTMSIRDAIKLKAGMEENEWIAMNTIEAYNTLLLIYGFVQDECTKEACKQMSAGSKYQYLWANEATGKADSLDAPTYVEKLFEWVASQIDDESIFPTNGNFTKKFLPAVKKILSRMFRVYAHIYYQHLNHITNTGAKEHLDKCFKHFYYFIDEFKLVGEKELSPLQPLIDQLK